MGDRPRGSGQRSEAKGGTKTASPHPPADPGGWGAVCHRPRRGKLGEGKAEFRLRSSVDPTVSCSLASVGSLTGKPRSSGNARCRRQRS